MHRLSPRLLWALLFVLSGSTFAAPSQEEVGIGKRCTATISSPTDVTPANLACTTINIESFEMTPGQTLAFTGLASGTTVNLLGEVTFGFANWEGPLFTIGTASPNGTLFSTAMAILSTGAMYWDGQGTNGGVTKPHPMLRIVSGGGIFKDVTALNSPAHAISVESTAPMTVTGVTINDSAGVALGHNTDCFDVSASELTITGNTCVNQDDCLAINEGTNILFQDNSCTGGHGISIGSIASNKSVSNVLITDNQVMSSQNGLRIKTIYEATNASVTNIVYQNNQLSNITQYGVVIEQDYENGGPTGVPTNGVVVGPITMTGSNTVAVSSSAEQVYVLCGTNCTAVWDWSGLTTSGGTPGSSNYGNITGYTV